MSQEFLPREPPVKHRQSATLLKDGHDRQLPETLPQKRWWLTLQRGYGKNHTEEEAAWLDVRENRTMDLGDLLEPSATAVVTMELQRGVVGDLASLPQLRDAAIAVDMLTNAGRVCASARGIDATVVHCTAEFRPDRKGSVNNARILAVSAQLNGDRLDRGAPGTELIPELGAESSDLIVPRSHGLTPFVATELDQLLRNCGIRTVVAVGNSVNIGILGLVLVAVDLGYQVVIPRDAVVGVPVEYGETVIDNTLALLATLTTTDDLVAAWSRAD